MSQPDKAAAAQAAQPPAVDLKKAGIIVTVILAVIIWLANPFSGLSAQGHGVIAVTLIALAFWIFRPPTLPYFAGGAILMAGGLLVKLPLNVVTAGYVSPALWVLIPALYFGFALAKTGLGKRICYGVLKSF